MFGGDEYQSRTAPGSPARRLCRRRCMNPISRGGGRVLAATGTLREVIASSPIRDEIAPQLWAHGCTKVWLSRSSIKRWALAPEPRRLP